MDGNAVDDNFSSFSATVKNQKNKQQQTTTTMKSWRKRQDGEQTQDATL
jgi:hypothetical protein